MAFAPGAQHTLTPADRSKGGRTVAKRKALAWEAYKQSLEDSGGEGIGSKLSLDVDTRIRVNPLPSIDDKRSALLSAFQSGLPGEIVPKRSWQPGKRIRLPNPAILDAAPSAQAVETQQDTAPMSANTIDADAAPPPAGGAGTGASSAPGAPPGVGGQA